MRASPGSVDLLARSPASSTAPAVVTSDRVYTFGALDVLVEEHAAALREAGVGPGSVRPGVMEASLEGITELLALWRVGAVPVPLNARWTSRERAAAVGALPPTLDVQVVLWTSGTGGRPRGVALSFANLAANARASAERLDLRADDLWLASLSPAHVGGLALLTRALLLGCAVLADGGFDGDRAAAYIDGGPLPSTGPSAVSHVSLVPTQLVRLLEATGDRAPPPTFRCALVGGARAPVSLVARAHAAGWPVALTYGCTEMSSQVATAPPSLTSVDASTVGAPLPGVEVAIGPDGEIRTRGTTLAVGTVGSASGALQPLVDEAGWYRTGDLGTVDTDGRLRVTGRRSDRIVSGGVTIDAVEVEEALRAHPRVADACVVGLPDEEWGERVAAWVVSSPVGLDRAELEAHLRAGLSGPKIPRVWLLGGGLPRNANGKVDRTAVRERLEEAAGGDASPGG